MRREIGRLLRRLAAFIDPPARHPNAVFAQIRRSGYDLGEVLWGTTGQGSRIEGRVFSPSGDLLFRVAIYDEEWDEREPAGQLHAILDGYYSLTPAQRRDSMSM